MTYLMTLRPHLCHCPVGCLDNGVNLDIRVLQRRDGQHGLLGHQAVQVAYANRHHAHSSCFGDLESSFFESTHKKSKNKELVSYNS